MGLLDSVIGALGQQGQGGQPAAAGQGGGQADLLSMVVGMLTHGGAAGGSGAVGSSASAGGLGGLVNLVEQFQQGGMGHLVQSWIGGGQNLPVSADQLNGVLGNDTVANMASKLGMNQGDLLGQLSHLLPQVVDKLTPNGQVQQPGTGGLGDLAGMLGGMLNHKG